MSNEYLDLINHIINKEKGYIQIGFKKSYTKKQLQKIIESLHKKIIYEIELHDKYIKF